MKILLAVDGSAYTKRMLGYFAAHSISTITHALGVTSGVIVALIAVGLLWAWHRRSSDA